MPTIRVNDDKENWLKKLFNTDQHGCVNFFSGPRGSGKTHTAVQFMHDLVKKHDYACITNVQFLDSEGKREMPEDVYFATDFKSMWEKIAEIRSVDHEKPILICIDEIQELIHRYRSTSSASVIMDKFFRQFRKNKFAGLFISQNIYPSIPTNLLYSANYIILKSKRITKRLNKHLSEREKKALLKANNIARSYIKTYDFSFAIDVQGGIFKEVDVDKNKTEKKEIKQFRDYNIKLEDSKITIGSEGVDWTNKAMSGPTYSTSASAVFNIRSRFNEKPKAWVLSLMSEIGECTPRELSDTIKEFFEKKEREEKAEWTKQQIFKLYENTDMTWSDLSQITGKPEGTIKSAYYRR